GPTEATVATTSVQVDQEILKIYTLLPVGYAKSDSRILILDDNDYPVVDGTHGEIIIAGANVSPGYIDRVDLTAAVFFELEGAPGMRAYRTGDQGHMRDGLLFFDGRLDNQVKLHGYRIEIGDVEANIQLLPHVRDAVVIVKIKDSVPDSLSAFVI